MLFSLIRIFLECIEIDGLTGHQYCIKVVTCNPRIQCLSNPVSQAIIPCLRADISCRHQIGMVVTDHELNGTVYLK